MEIWFWLADQERILEIWRLLMIESEDFQKFRKNLGKSPNLRKTRKSKGIFKKSWKIPAKIQKKSGKFSNKDPSLPSISNKTLIQYNKFLQLQVDDIRLISAANCHIYDNVSSHQFFHSSIFMGFSRARMQSNNCRWILLLIGDTVCSIHDANVKIYFLSFLTMLNRFSINIYFSPMMIKKKAIS